MLKSIHFNIRGQQGRRGFSTLEVFAALTVGMILSVLAVSSFRLVVSDLPLDSAAQRFNHMAATARAWAIGRNSIYTLQIDTNQDNFWVDETNNQGIPIVSKVVRPEPLDDRVVIDRVTFGQNAAVNNPLNLTPIRFFPDGSSDDVRIFLREANPRDPGAVQFRTIRIYGPTGHSRIFDGEVN